MSIVVPSRDIANDFMDGDSNDPHVQGRVSLQLCGEMKQLLHRIQHLFSNVFLEQCLDYSFSL